MVNPNPSTNKKIIKDLLRFNKKQLEKNEGTLANFIDNLNNKNVFYNKLENSTW
jgi:hypothetical protein